MRVVRSAKIGGFTAMDFECPFCGKFLELEPSDFPKSASFRDVFFDEKETKVKCPSCDCKFFVTVDITSLGWRIDQPKCEDCEDWCNPGCFVQGGCRKVQ